MPPVESTADRASFFADFGESDGSGVPELKWTAGAVTSPVAGHFHRGTVRMEADDGFGAINTRATFHCALEALPIGAAAEQAVVFQSINYSVKSIEPDNTGMVVVLLEEVVED
ncbi:MAG: hypothetical protein EOP24_07980 [Hyphomicrobiales bacterium]|nr:MAG: hypothetical protein EOP24_07980 [Hyphomicrobiales bacterium]